MFETLKTDKALAEEFQSALKAAKTETAEQAKTVILLFAVQQNLTFTADELAEFEMETHKLPEEELDQVNAAGPSDNSYPKENHAQSSVILSLT